MLSKVELKKQLATMGIKVVEGNYVRKTDIEKILKKECVAVNYPKGLTYKNKIYPIYHSKYKRGTNEVYYIDLGEKNKVREVDLEHLKLVSREEKDFGNKFESIYEIIDSGAFRSSISKNDLVGCL